MERIENFNRAYNILADAVKAFKPDSVLTHMALIQAFEVTFELAWKILKDYLYANGVTANLPREVIKEAFSFEVIKNGKIWIDMLDDRNASSHEYNMDKILTILNKITTVYFEELSRFYKEVESWGNE